MLKVGNEAKGVCIYARICACVWVCRECLCGVGGGSLQCLIVEVVNIKGKGGQNRCKFFSLSFFLVVEIYLYVGFFFMFLFLPVV